MLEHICRKNPVFGITFVIPDKLNFDLLTRIMICIGKHYPNYMLIDNNVNRKPRVVNWMNEFISGRDFQVEIGNMYSLELATPFFYKNSKGVTTTYTPKERGMQIFYDFEKSDKTHNLLISFYLDAYTNVNYLFNNGKYERVEQIEIATINRKILSNFLTDLRVVLDDNSIEVFSDHIKAKYLSKFGISEDATLKENHPA